MLSNEQILKRIRDKIDHPVTVRELLQAVRVPREQHQTFKRRITALVAAGALIRTRGNRYGLPDKMNLVVGRADVNPRGFGFVVPARAPAGVAGDIYVAGVNLNQAMHGDRVVVRIEHRKGDRAEGRIVRILKRAVAAVTGRYDIDDSGLGFVAPFDRRLLMDVHIPKGAHGGAEPGEMVDVELARWPTPTRNAIGRVVQVLGDIDAPGVDVRIMIRKYRLPDSHGEEALVEAKRLGHAVAEGDLRGRTDFRNLQTVTIDGEDARDFDDAVTIERVPNGHYRLGVHIADVSHYVRAGSALDVEAYERGTSVYFPDRAVHMFPETLATGLCSLNPGIDRLVQSCLMEIDRQGEVVRYEMHDGVIRSDARLTYAAVNAILTDRARDAVARYQDFVPLLEVMEKLFHLLRHRRHRRGSIDFDLKEPEIIMDDAGLVEEIIATERNIAHRIIEEFMLVANETVAGHLERHEIPTLYRVHEAPDPLKVAEFEEFISTLGFGLGTSGTPPRPGDFQRLFERLHGKPEEKPIAFLMLRTMQKARYDAVSMGHFGLATSSYTHFTSPIRRYPDLVVHRVLREARTGLLDGERDRKLREDLPEMARHTSERERRAEEAERELVQWKKVRFMVDKVGDEFSGYVVGVTAFGLFIELVEHFVEGLVHISTMADDYYRFIERAHQLRGENTRTTYRLGDQVRVQVVRVDQERRQIDLGLVDILERVRAAARPRAARERPARPGHARRRRGRRERPGRERR